MASFADVDTWLSRKSYVYVLISRDTIEQFAIGVFLVFCDSKSRVYFLDSLMQKERLYVIGLRERRKLIHFSFQLIS